MSDRCGQGQLTQRGMNECNEYASYILMNGLGAASTHCMHACSMGRVYLPLPPPEVIFDDGLIGRYWAPS